MKRHENDVTQRRWIQIKSLSSPIPLSTRYWYDSCWATNSKAFKCIQSNGVYVQHHKKYFTPLPALSTSLNHLGWLVLAVQHTRHTSYIPLDQVLTWNQFPGTKGPSLFLAICILQHLHVHTSHSGIQHAHLVMPQNPQNRILHIVIVILKKYDYKKYLKTKGLNNIVVKNT